MVFQLLYEPRVGQQVQLVTGWQRECFFDRIPEIKGFSSVVVHPTQAHGMRRIAHMK